MSTYETTVKPVVLKAWRAKHAPRQFVHTQIPNGIHTSSAYKDVLFVSEIHNKEGRETHCGSSDTLLRDAP
jgi:hypothetical protein